MNQQTYLSYCFHPGITDIKVLWAQMIDRNAALLYVYYNGWRKRSGNMDHLLERFFLNDSGLILHSDQ